MPVFKVQKVPKKEKDWSAEEILAKFCYHYTQYSFSQARKLPFRRILQMLKVAEKEHARYMFDMTRAILAPHTKNPKGVLEYFKKLAEK